MSDLVPDLVPAFHDIGFAFCVALMWVAAFVVPGLCQ